MTEKENLTPAPESGLGKAVKKIAEAVTKGKKEKGVQAAEATSAEKPKSRKRQTEAAHTSGIQPDAAGQTLKPKERSVVEARQHIEAARRSSGVLKDIIPSKLPKDEQLILILDQTAQMLENGATLADAERFYRLHRQEIWQVDGEIEIWQRLLLKSRGEEITPENLRLVGLEGVGTPRATPPGPGDELLDNLDFSSFSTDIQTEMSALWDNLNAQGTTSERMVMQMKDTITRWKKTIEKNKNPSQRVLQTDTIAQLEQRVRTVEDRLRTIEHRAEETPDKIRPTYAEMDQMFKDPVGFLDRQLAEAIRLLRENTTDDLAVKHILDRLELQYTWLFSDEYAIRRGEFFVNGPIPAGITDPAAWLEAQRLATRQRLRGGVKEISTTVSRRINTCYFVERLSKAPNLEDKDFINLMNRMKESDWFAQDGDLGGLVGHARKVYTAVLESMLWNDQDRLRMITPKDYEIARRRTIEILRTEKQTLQPVYDQYRRGELYTHDPRGIEVAMGPDIGMNYDQACEFMVDLAEIRSQMFWDDTALEIRGIGPNEMQLIGQEGYESYTRRGRLHPLFRYFAWNEELWGSLSGNPATEKAFFRHLGDFWTSSHPEAKKWAQERTDKFWDRIQATIHTNTAGMTPQQLEQYTKERERLYGEIKVLFFFNPDLTELPGDPHQFARFVERLTKERIFEEQRIRTGLDIAEAHLARAYFPLGSGWRDRTFRLAVNETLGEFYKRKLGLASTKELNGTDYDGLCTSIRLVLAANEYYIDKFNGENPHARAHFLDQAKTVAEYRPFGLLSAMHERESATLDQWFRTQGNIYGHQHLTDLIREVTLRADTINDRLIRAGHLPINYRHPLVAGDPRLAIVGEVFASTLPDQKLDQTQYFTVMQSMCDYLLEPTVEQRTMGARFGALEELTDIRYEMKFIHPRWDDTPFFLIEDPRLISQLLGHTGPDPLPEFIKLSSRCVGGGNRTEADGPMKRQIRDNFGTAYLANQAINRVITTDEKEAIKALVDVMKVTFHNGPDHARFAYTGLEYSWLAMAKVNPRFGPLFEGMPNACDWNKFADAEFKARSQDELRHTQEKFQAATRGKTEANAPKAEGIFELENAKLNITNWRAILGGRFSRLSQRLEAHPDATRAVEKVLKWMNERMPTGIWTRIKIPFAVGAIVLFLAIYSFKEVGNKKESGGGHGGGH